VVFSVLLLLLAVTAGAVGFAAIIDIEMMADKQVYNVGELVQFSGNVTKDGVPVTDALVGFEVVSPYGNPFMIRTFKTGAFTGYWKIQILMVQTCDAMMNPKTIFARGETAYLSVTVSNGDTVLHHVKGGVYIQYSDRTPFIAFYPFEKDLDPEIAETYTVSLPIPGDAPAGQAVIYASVFPNSPVVGGTPYCPEKTGSFYIVSTTPAAPPQPPYFGMSFRVPLRGAKLGTYTMYARSSYQGSLATEIKGLQVVLLGDMNGDWKIDMRDIGALCNLYGKREGQPGWNPNADIYVDGVINMRDVGMECGIYGATAEP